jgi:hypothetical protein
MALLKSQLMVGVLPFGCNWPGPQHPLVERIALLQRKPPGAARRLAGVGLVILAAISAGLGAWAAQPPVTAKSMAASANPTGGGRAYAGKGVSKPFNDHERPSERRTSAAAHHRKLHRRLANKPSCDKSSCAVSNK